VFGREKDRLPPPHILDFLLFVFSSSDSPPAGLS
jgi:hypothetical protein